MADLLQSVACAVDLAAHVTYIGNIKRRYHAPLFERTI